MNFANNLNYDEYVEDLEVKTIVECLKNRIENINSQNHQKVEILEKNNDNKKENLIVKKKESNDEYIRDYSNNIEKEDNGSHHSSS